MKAVFGVFKIAVVLAALGFFAWTVSRAILADIATAGTTAPVWVQSFKEMSESSLLRTFREVANLTEPASSRDVDLLLGAFERQCAQSESVPDERASLMFSVLQIVLAKQPGSVVCRDAAFAAAMHSKSANWRRAALEVFGRDNVMTPRIAEEMAVAAARDTDEYIRTRCSDRLHAYVSLKDARKAIALSRLLDAIEGKSAISLDEIRERIRHLLDEP